MEGIAASPGIAIGKAHLKATPRVKIKKKTIKKEKVDQEIKRFRQALNRVEKELTEIKEYIYEEIGEEKANIFQAHLMLLSDPELVPAIEKRIKQKQISAEAAVDEVIGRYVKLFANMEDEYMKGRKADLEDVGNQIIKLLIGQEQETEELDKEVIIIAQDLSPSDTAQLNKSFVQAFVTEQGSRTSHSAIMAQSLGIPAVVGVGSQLLKEIKQDDLLIVDGNEGRVIIRPDSTTLKKYENKLEQYHKKRAELSSYRDKEAKTKDGKKIEIAGNIGNLEDLDSVIEQGGEGIGLFRTEFLYMDRDHLPTEEEQFQVYKQVAKKMKEKPVIIRTLDIGGGKNLPYLDFPGEKNPFLGYRAIRICLERPEIFKPQLRAILRASKYGNIKLIYPMISSLEELQAANKMLAKVKNDLEQKKIEYDDIDVGIMIEIPATVMIAETLAKKTDFFSIGTNDLIQYMMAVDRNNEKIANLHSHYHPSVLRVLNKILKSAGRHNIWVSICGEAAGDELLIPFLLGIGLEKLSMSAISILKIKNNIRHWSLRESRQIAKKLLNYNTAEQVKAVLEKLYKQKEMKKDE